MRSIYQDSPSNPWGSPPFALTPILEEQPQQLSDVPPGPNDLSPALVHKLADLGVEAITLLCQYRNLRTVRALWQLDAGERKLFLIAARQQYQLLGVFPSNIKINLEQLFGPIGYPEEQIPFGMHGMYAEIWQQRQQQVPFPEPPEPLVDDSSLRRKIGENLLALRHYIGDARYTECLRRLTRADEHAVAALSETAEALAAICVEFPESSRAFNVCKDAKSVTRDFLLWRAASTCPGMDSTPALKRAWLDACRFTRFPCDANIDSQLQNSLRRIKEMLGGGPPPKKQADRDHSPERLPANNKQGSVSSSSSSSSTSTWQLGRSSEDHAQNASRKVRFDLNGPNSMDQILDPDADLHKPIVVKPRQPWRPPGLERGFDAPQSGEHRSPSLDRAPGGRTTAEDQSLQMAQMLEMMQVLRKEVMELKSCSRCD